MNLMMLLLILIGYFESLYRVLEVQMFLINASSINSLDAVVFEQKSYKEAVRQPCSGYQERARSRAVWL